jgi:hypothetical protein
MKFQNKPFSAYEAFRGYIHLAKSEVGKRISLTVPEIDISFTLKWLQFERAAA